MSVVDEVKQKIDIVDFIGSYVTLKRAGRNHKALCPFHNEKTPSFIVSPDQGTWHCFGACATGGDIFTFLMRRENLDFGEALRRLAQRAGVQLVRDAGEDTERKRLRQLLAAAAAQYHYQLKSHTAARFARDYLVQRFVSPEAVALFELGFALNEWDGLKAAMLAKGYGVNELEAAGLIVAGESGSHYDRFRGRLMFPIRNRSAEVVGFGARALGDEEPKYLNSPQTVLFDKSGTLYGLDQAADAIRAQDLAVIVEGYMDVIGAHQADFKNVVASLGTALTEKQLGLVKRLTKRYALALDPDAAGEEATKRGLEVARQALGRKTTPVPIGAGMIGFEERLEAELLVIPMPRGQDPDEIIHADPARWNALVASAEPLVEYYFRVLTQDLDLNTARDKSVAVKRLVPILREIGDAVQRTHYVQRLAQMVKVPEKTLTEEITKRTERRADRSAPQRTTILQSPRAETRLEEHYLALAMCAPRFLRKSVLEQEDFGDAPSRALFQALRSFVLESNRVDLDAFREMLDEPLQPLFDALAERTKAFVDLKEQEIGREIESAAYRLRAHRDRNELTQLEFLLRDTDLAQDEAEKKVLHTRAEFLRRRIAENHRALGARAIV